MSQTAVAKLGPFINDIAPWIEAHPSTPEPWRRNVRAFLRNQAEAVPHIGAWKWLRRAIAHPRDDRIIAPFAWIRAVLQNPLEHIVERTRSSRGQQREREIGTETIHSLISSGSLPAHVMSKEEERGALRAEAERVRKDMRRGPLAYRYY